MEKRYEYSSGAVVVEKATKDGKPALKVTVTSDNVTMYFGHTYEHTRDRAFQNFNQRNADVIYRSVMNFSI